MRTDIRFALRELRQGRKHFTVLFACLALAASVTAAIGVFDAAAERALTREAQSLLGGDLEIYTRSGEPEEQARAFIASLGDVSYIRESRTMLHAGDDIHTLVELKAVDNAYPLLGRLETEPPQAGISTLGDSGILVDATFTERTGLKTGDNVTLGEAEYTIKGVIMREPDRAVQLFAFGPRVMLTHEGLDRSKLAGSLSLIRHAFRVNVPEGVIADEAYEKRLEKIFRDDFPSRAWGVRSGNDGNNAVDRFIGRFFAFLTLSALATFLIAGAGVSGSVRAYAEKKARTIAILKTLGASRGNVLRIYAFVLFALATAAGIIGVIIALITGYLLLPLAAKALPALEGASPSLFAALPALLYVYLFCYLFAAPVLLSARDVKPASLFRSPGALLIRISPAVIGVTAALAFAALALFILDARDRGLVAGAAVLLLAGFVLLWACAAGLRAVVKRVRPRRPWLALALANLTRPGAASGAVIPAFGISLTALIALTLIETNLRARITEAVEREAPALFMIDIQDYRKDALAAFLQENRYAAGGAMYPMARGRVVKLNGVPVGQAEVGDNARWITRGDRGLSYAAEPPANADIIAGEWWPADYDGEPLVSVDERLLEGANLKLGDTITVNVLGEEITATIASAREIDYSTFQINFAMMFSPNALRDFPVTYVSTAYEKPGAPHGALLRDTAQAFPEITIISAREVVRLVKDVLSKLALALRAAVAVTLLAGALVLISALGAALDRRIYDVAVLKTVGARRADIVKSCLAEWTLPALSVSGAAILTGVTGAYLVGERFGAKQFDPRPDIIIAVIAAGLALVWTVGFIGNRRLFAVRPGGVLRNE